jgi:KRAB domain-containing zinc finger protein
MLYCGVMLIVILSSSNFVFAAEQADLSLSAQKVHFVSAKRFACEVCGMELSQRSGLVNHMRVHTGEKPFECTVCSRAFSQSCNLTRHVKQVHKQERQFVCSVEDCDKTFKRKLGLVNHEKIHIKDHFSTYVAFHKTFSRLDTLKNHRDVKHKKTPRYVCPECGQNNASKIDLQSHLQAHRRDRVHTKKRLEHRDPVFLRAENRNAMFNPGVVVDD